MKLKAELSTEVNNCDALMLNSMNILYFSK